MDISKRKNQSAWIIILMGVSGSGKTTVGRILAKDLGWPFYEGDDYHPPRNIEKMRRGLPLNDQDRIPWLASLKDLIIHLTDISQPAIITCSALRHAYRDNLTKGYPHVSFVHLKGSFSLIHRRLESRDHHFMKSDMLASQFKTLEEPVHAFTVNITHTPEMIAEQIKETLKLP